MLLVKEKFTRESCRNKFLNIQIKNYVKKKNPKMIQIRIFKKMKKEGSEEKLQLNGQWKVSMFVGLKRLQAWWPIKGSNVWWPMKGSKLDGHWKEKEKHPLQLFSLPPPPTHNNE